MCSINKRTACIAIALSVVTVIALGLAIFTPVANAETPYDITPCMSGTITMLSQSKEMTVLSMDLKGIARSNHENKVFDNYTFHYVGVYRFTAGKLIAQHGYTKFMDPDGDCFLVEVSNVGGQSSVTKLLHGTGKWKGITGGGELKIIAQGKPIKPGTWQGCARHIGTFELPK
jgi:hypothetical protein